jgi:hypothetical protein
VESEIGDSIVINFKARKFDHIGLQDFIISGIKGESSSTNHQHFLDNINRSQAAAFPFLDQFFRKIASATSQLQNSMIRIKGGKTGNNTVEHFIIVRDKFPDSFFIITTTGKIIM